MKGLSVREVIRRLLEYNLDAGFEVISNNKVSDYEFAIGTSENCTRQNCESVSIYCKDSNNTENSISDKIKISSPTLKEEAKAFVNSIYQPMGYIVKDLNSNQMWEWASERAIENIEIFVSKMVEGSSIWLYHRKLIDEIRKNK